MDDSFTNQEPKSKQLESESKESASQENDEASFELFFKSKLNYSGLTKPAPKGIKNPNRKRIREGLDQLFKEVLESSGSPTKIPKLKKPPSDGLKLGKAPLNSPKSEKIPPISQKFEKTLPISPKSEYSQTISPKSEKTPSSSPFYQNQLEDPEVYALHWEQYFT